MEPSILYHASPVPDIQILEPRISNHGTAKVYFSTKRENVLVYLSNAIEKYCKEQGFPHSGIWQKWASYGFTKEGKMCIEEYYPNALKDTYQGVSGYIYSVTQQASCISLPDIPQAYYTDVPAAVNYCAFIPDAYDAILEAEQNGLLVIARYEDMNLVNKRWIEKTIRQEYETSSDHPEYRFFLRGKFPFLNQ